MVANAFPETQKKNDQKSQGDSNPKQMAELKDVCDAAYQGFCEYAKSRPETIALWCLGVGFVLGWKLRPR